ncbi:minor capsid protein [Clostridium botulinum]|uniref:minor capsid protein n=1 Tax=Clostridium botulinum TaxID=1491 RepID=UPI001E38567B|nr:minor capsid protein [Clostridium botulinum]MCD3254377.1 minor capsid protein [Clostridium botulinum C/D]MCD3279877.1 minor capsid protein [Clostridium botulinum C/D]MCD3339608.1 minor capsid protein [Clostridium botulinum C/D]MCD3357516.1 minor capsid protein [Clostridium botulinum C/D]
MDKNTQYWINRIERVMRDVHNSQEDRNIVLLQGYSNALKDVKKELYQLYEKMNSSSVSLSESYKYNRLKIVQKQIQNIIKELGNKEQKFFDTNLEKNYIQASEQVGRELETKLNIKFNEVDRKTIDKALTYPWSGADYSNRIWKNKDKLIEQLNQTLIRGLVQGTKATTVAKEISKKMNVGAYEALRLVRTENAHMVNSATIDRYRESGVVEKVIWIAGNKPCPKCEILDREVFLLDKVPMLPQHPNCKCCIAPHFKK